MKSNIEINFIADENVLNFYHPGSVEQSRELQILSARANLYLICQRILYEQIDLH